RTRRCSGTAAAARTISEYTELPRARATVRAMQLLSRRHHGCDTNREAQLSEPPSSDIASLGGGAKLQQEAEHALRDGLAPGAHRAWASLPHRCRRTRWAARYRFPWFPCCRFLRRRLLARSRSREASCEARIGSQCSVLGDEDPIERRARPSWRRCARRQRLDGAWRVAGRQTQGRREAREEDR